MKRLTCVVLGCGDRGMRYAAYAKIAPKELEVIGAIDISEMRLGRMKQAFSLSDEQLYRNLSQFLEGNVQCDVVINATMDQLHYSTSMQLLEKGYNVLLEKPITANVDELLEIERKAKENGCKVVICHVLRYTPFYSKIKEIVDSGKIGKIVNMQLNEHVWVGHFIGAYVRGKWRSEKECGSGLLLAKCCHDTDLLCWLNNATAPSKVSSFGQKAYFMEENAPQGATRYCYECPCREECIYNTERFTIERDFTPFYTWAAIGKPIEEITLEEKKAFLTKDVYGQCAFKTDMDIVDRQCVSVQFANGSIATLNMVGATCKAGRHIHIICEYGEILGYVEENKLTVRVFNRTRMEYDESVIDLSAEVDLSKEDNSIGGHYGGDYYIMKDLVRFLNDEATSAATTVISDSINGHLICYAAEKARKQSVVVDLSVEYSR